MKSLIKLTNEFLIAVLRSNARNLKALHENIVNTIMLQDFTFDASVVFSTVKKKDIKKIKWIEDECTQLTIQNYKL